MTTQSPNALELIPRESKDLMMEALEFIGSVTQITVRSDGEYENAAELRKKIKGHLKTLDTDRKDLVKPLNDQVKSINDEYRTVTTKLDNGERQIKRAMSAYYQEKERKRIEEQRKLEAEAAERRRKAEEKAEAERQKAEQYREQGRDDMAEKAEARAETAEDVAFSTVADVAEVTPKAKGISYRTDYVCELADKAAAVAACMANPAAEGAVSINLKELERLAKVTKGAIKVAGVTYREKKTPIVRS